MSFSVATTGDSLIPAFLRCRKIAIHKIQFFFHYKFSLKRDYVEIKLNDSLDW